MKMLIIFPKESAYDSRDNEEKRLYMSKFKEHISFLTHHGVDIELLAEDSLGMRILNDMEIPYALSRVTSDADIRFASINPTLELCSDFMLSNYQNIPYVDTGSNERYPLIDRRSVSKEEYIPKRAELCTKRVRYGIETFVKSHPAVLYFKSANTNICSSQITKLNTGDGKLYIEVDLNSYMVSCYYGGVWIERNMVNQILECM